MNITDNCPEPRLLGRFLEDGEFPADLSTWTRHGIEQHINDCEACQRSMELLVSGLDSWEGTARQLVELDRLRNETSSQNSALRELIEHIKERSLEEFVSDPVGTDTE